ncbi:UAA-domain-containing protein [Auriculariales sp. MPI-PUGE-AT-0066]|nr:UAA-domain-containing protein [Auriculariales sp. MPI-PUGE-AT-0066]
MPSSSDIALAVLSSAVTDWFSIVSLVFGGCCSNALATEWLTHENAHVGKLITFAQFSIVSLVGLRKSLEVRDPGRTRNTSALEVAAQRITSARQRRQDVFAVALDGEPGEHVDSFAARLRNRLAELDTSLNVRTFDQFNAYIPPAPHQGIPSEPEVVIVSGRAVRHPKSKWDASIALGPVNTAITSTLHLSPTGERIVGATGIFAPRSLLWKVLHIRLKPRKIPIRVWLIQVALFLLTSLLNNIAFGYKVPMGVHIIFRSGGSLTNMLVGWMMGKKYTRDQVLSILLVTAGVAASTYSAIPRGPHISAQTAATDTSIYLVGIGILALALVLSSFMGLEQDRVYKKYGRGHWEEAMFYLHFLAMPMFAMMWGDISGQITTANASPPMRLSVASLAGIGAQRIGGPFMGVQVPLWARIGVTLPSLWVPLALNVGTQLLCVGGVNRLTVRVSSLTVTLVLVLRKAVSLWISVMLMGRGESNMWLWCGAAMVLAGTVWYALDARRTQAKAKTKQE